MRCFLAREPLRKTAVFSAAVLALIGARQIITLAVRASG
jgi:hypothetical protein